MDELFRFVLMRPADLPAPDDAVTVTPTFVETGVSLEVARREARAFVQSASFLESPDQVAYARTVFGLATKLSGGSLALHDTQTVVRDLSGKSASEIVGDEQVVQDRRRLANSLVAMKLLSNSSGADAPGLAVAFQGFDALDQAAHDRDPVRLRVIVVPVFASTQQLAADAPAPPGGAQAPQAGERPAAGDEAAVPRVDAAIRALQRLPAASFAVSTMPARRPEAPAEADGAQPARMTPAVSVERPWVLSGDAASALTASVRQTLADHGLDPAVHDLPTMLTTLHDARGELLAAVPVSSAARTQIRQIGSIWLSAQPPNG